MQDGSARLSRALSVSSTTQNLHCVKYLGEILIDDVSCPSKNNNIRNKYSRKAPMYDFSPHAAIPSLVCTCSHSASSVYPAAQ